MCIGDGIGRRGLRHNAFPALILGLWGVLGVAMMTDRLAVGAPAFWGCVGCGLAFTWLHYVPKIFPIAAFCMALSLGFCLMKHWLPGVENTCVCSGLVVSPSAAPFSLWLNWDKPWVGAWALATLGTFRYVPRVFAPHVAGSWGKKVGSRVLFTLGSCALLMVLSWATGLVTWAPKIPPIWPVWLVSNLFLVSLPEEAFFRGFVQQTLCQACCFYGISWRWGWIGASVVFAAFHFPAPPVYLALSFLAGLLYGEIFHRNHSLIAPILLHFTVNTLHFFLFTYPFRVP